MKFISYDLESYWKSIWLTGHVLITFNGFLRNVHVALYKTAWGE